MGDNSANPQDIYPEDRLRKDLEIIAGCVIQSLSEGKSSDDFGTTMLVFIGEHDGPVATFRMVHGMPADQDVWPKVFSDVGKTFATNQSGTPVAAFFISHALASKAQNQQPIGDDVSAADLAKDLAAAASAWLNAGSYDDFAQPAEAENAPSEEVVLVRVCTSDHRLATATIHFERDDDCAICPVGDPDVAIGEGDDISNSMLPEFFEGFKQAKSTRTGWSQNIDPFR
jgi:hypothetical protein